MNFNPTEIIDINIILNTILILVIIIGIIIIIYNLLSLKREIEEVKKREKLLKDVVTAIRSTIDLNDLLKIICDEVAGLFNTERATIIEFPNKSNFQEWIVRREYKLTTETKGLSDIDYDVRTGEFIGKSLIEQGINLVIDDLATSNTPDYFKKSYTLMGVKSILSVPVKQLNDKWGIIFLAEYNRYRHWTKDEINLLETISDQIYIAIRQAELYTITKEQAEREKLLREIITAIRSTLDINELKKNLVTKIGSTFNANRCIIRDFNSATNTFLDLDFYSEYLSSPNDISIINVEPEKIQILTSILSKVQEKTPVIIQNIELFLKEKHPEDPKYLEFASKYNIKSLIDIPILYSDQLLGVLVMHFSEPRDFSEDDIDFITTLADQAGIALHQAKLYQSIQQAAKKETILREIITAISSTLDIDEIKNIIVQKIGRTFNADRTLLSEYDPVKKEFLPIDKNSEYLSDTKELSFSGYDWSKQEVKEFIDILKQKKEYNFTELNKFLYEHNLINTAIEKLFKSVNIISSYNIPILYRDELQGFFCIDFTYEKKELSQEDLVFLRTIANQAGIALYQAKLYQSIQQAAKKETILREIVSKIKVSENLNDIYEYIIHKIAEIYKVDRIIFIKTPSHRSERLNIDYEYIANTDLLSLKDTVLPEVCTETFLDLSRNLDISAIHDIRKYHKDNITAQEFFQKYKVSSILAAPFVRYNHNIKVLGVLVLCSKDLRTWTDNEIDLLKAISVTVVAILWDITRLLELRELRNIFVITLAHDLQVPIIGERRVLEFLGSRPDNQNIGKFKELISSTIKSNANLINLLIRLLDSYNYEAGNKVLNLNKQNLSNIINIVINSLQELALSKSITISLNIEENLPNIKVDQDEIKKVLYSLIENAIDYTQENGYVEIKSYLENNFVITCIVDNGPGIEIDLRDKLFDRYTMAQLLSRKIGSGLNLYIAKQIVNAHGGQIWYTPRPEGGSVFCFSLPVSHD